MDFQTLNTTFDRMCRFYEDEPTECPFYTITGSEEWEDWYMHGAFEPEEFEHVVTEWAKEHPIPIYPTFLELIHYIVNHGEDTSLIGLNIDELLDRRIPDAAAEELGLVPINECGLTKYCEDESEWR